MSVSEHKDFLRLSNEESKKISKESLRIALFKLMGEKEFESISITEIVRLAGVARNAFYRNYGTLEAILEDLEEDLICKLKEVLPKFGSEDAQAFSRFLSVIRERSQDFKILLTIRKSLSDRLGSGGDYAETAWKSAFTQLVIRWFENGMTESPEEMGAILYGLLSKIRCARIGR